MTHFKSALFALTLAFAAPSAIAAPGTPPAAVKAQGETITAKVNGLVCDFCAQSMKKVFGKEKSVAAVDVDLSKGEVRLTLKPGQSLADKRIGELVKKSGYALVAIDRKAAS